MAGNSMSNYMYTGIMSGVLKGTPFTYPATFYVALMKTLPNLDGTGGSEVSTSTTGYSRQPMSIAGGDWVGPNGAALVYANSKNIQFAKPTANWGTIVGICLFDAAVGGNLLWRGTGMSREVTAADAGPVINAGQMEVHMATC